MKNDEEIKAEIRSIKTLADEYLSLPNACAYSDSIVDALLGHAEKLKGLHDSNGPG